MTSLQNNNLDEKKDMNYLAWLLLFCNEFVEILADSIEFIMDYGALELLFLWYSLRELSVLVFKHVLFRCVNIWFNCRTSFPPLFQNWFAVECSSCFTSVMNLDYMFAVLIR